MSVSLVYAPIIIGGIAAAYEIYRSFLPGSAFRQAFGLSS